MKICHCTLPLINPKACEGCATYSYGVGFPFPDEPLDPKISEFMKKAGKAQGDKIVEWYMRAMMKPSDWAYIKDFLRGTHVAVNILIERYFPSYSVEGKSLREKLDFIIEKWEENKSEEGL